MSRLHAEQVKQTAIGVSPSGSLHEGPVAMDTVALLDFDIDRVSRLVLASERSLALVNRRALAATLANVQPDPGQVLPPAPPFAEAVAIAREDGQLVERMRLFLATHPRAIEELTPELTRTLVRIFDPSGRTARLITTRSPILNYAVTGAAVIGAITLLTSTTLLISTIAGRLTHAPVAISQSDKATRGVSPAALSRIPGKTAAIPDKQIAVNHQLSTGATTLLAKSATDSSASNDSAKKVQPATVPQASAHDGAAVPAKSASSQANPIGTAATIAPAVISGALPALETNRGNAPVVGVSAEAKKVGATAPHELASAAPNTGGRAATSGTTSTTSTTAPANDAAPVGAGSAKADKLNDLPPYSPQAIRATGSASATTAAQASPSTPSPAAKAASGESSGAATPSDVEALRNAAARTYVDRNITTVDPSARVEWMHVHHSAPDVIRIEALVRTDAASSVMHYTLHDNGTGFTLVEKLSTPNM